MEVTVTVPGDIWPRRRDWKGELVNVLKAEGDTVAKGEAIAEVEVEKAVILVNSEFQGKVKRVVGRRGEEVGPGSAILVLEV